MTQVLFYIVDTKCGRTCRYCFYETGHSPRTRAELSQGDWVELTERAADEGVEGIVITGGEPLAGGDERVAAIENVVKKASSKNIHTLLITDGEKLSFDVAGRLAAAGLNAVSVGQDCLSGVPGHKVRGWKGIEAALRRGLRTTIIMTVTLENIFEMPSILRFARARKIGLIVQPAFIPYESEEFERLSLESPPEESKQGRFRRLIDWAEESDLVDYASYLKHLAGIDGGRRPDHCDMGTRVGVIDADGSVMPCFHRRDLIVGKYPARPLRELLDDLKKVAPKVRDASCFGTHCVSLFAGS